VRSRIIDIRGAAANGFSRAGRSGLGNSGGWHLKGCQREYCHRAHCAEKGRQAWAQRYVGAARCAGGPLRTADHKDRSSALSEQYDRLRELLSAAGKHLRRGQRRPHHRQGFHLVRPGRRDCRRRDGEYVLKWAKTTPTAATDRSCITRWLQTFLDRDEDRGVPRLRLEGGALPRPA
jgi:hypothetical protein